MSADRDQVLAKVREHLSAELGVPAENITESTSFRDDLDADSLDLYELVMELEDSYSIRVEADRAAKIKTVGDAVDFVAERITV